MAGCIAVFERGVVPFTTKTRNTQNAGAVAALVIQTGDTWPYAMTDKSNKGGDLVRGRMIVTVIV